VGGAGERVCRLAPAQVARARVVLSAPGRGWGGGDPGREPIAGKVVGMEPIPVEAFEALVADALDSIPDRLRSEMDNVAVLVDDASPPGPLYGLYEGVPLTERGYYSGASPDRITLYLATICASAATPDELAHQVRVTLLHEVAHHFGIDDDRLDELGWS